MGAHLRATNLYAVGWFDPDHDAVIRIGGNELHPGFPEAVLFETYAAMQNAAMQVNTSWA